MPTIPLTELQSRWQRLRSSLPPEAGGLLVFSRLNIYYLTGTFGSGLLWLPLEGQPIYMCRRGHERARSESPLTQIAPFKSYSDINPVLKSFGQDLPTTIAAEMNGLSWALSNSLNKYLSNHRIISGDGALSLTRAHKSASELALMRQAGARHARCLVEQIPAHIRPGMTEMEIGLRLMDLCHKEGHHGILRMEKYGEEVFMGHISSGNSGLSSSVFNGALGLRGMHPSTPHMGSADKIWQPGEILMIDVGFSFEGYQTDKSHLYFAGKESDILATVRGAQDFCIEMQAWIADRLRPGAVPSALWSDCKAWAERAGYAEGFMGMGDNKVEFVGHGIGLAIDEYPVIARGFDQPLAEGMTLAIEPKVAIEGIGMAGIENTFEVTPKGGVSLTGTDYRIICI